MNNSLIRHLSNIATELHVISDDGEIIQPGQYKYEVNYTLPYGIPSSFEGVYGSVRYTAKVNIDKLFKDNNDMAQEFKVETPFDEPESTITNTNQFFNQMQPPIRVDNSVDYCCCGCRPSSLQITTTTTSGRYETGQSIPLTVECHNSKNVHKFKLDITLCKITSYHSTLPVTEVKRQTEILSKLTLTNKDHFDTKTWAGNLKVPFIDIPNLHKCAIIDIKFVIQTSVSIDGALRNIELNEIMLHIEPGEPIINCEAHAKLAPLQDTMEEFDSLLFYENTESRKLLNPFNFFYQSN